MKYTRLFAIISVIFLLNNACISTELVSEERVAGSDRVAGYTGEFTVSTFSNPSRDDTGVLQIKEQAAIEYRQNFHYNREHKWRETLGWISLSMIFVIPLIDYDFDTEELGDTGGAIFLTGLGVLITAYLVPTTEKEITKTEVRRENSYLDPEFAEVEVESKTKRLNTGKVEIDLYREIGVLTAHSLNKRVQVRYKNTTKAAQIDLRQRNLTPSLARLAEYNDQIERFEDIRESWIARYVDREIDQLMTPRGEFETELDYLNRIGQIENRRDELTKQAEESYAEQLRDFMKPVEREREHINRQFEKSFSASVENVNYSVDSELLEFRLRFTETSTPSFGIRTRLSRSIASTLVPYLRRAGGRAAEVEFIMSDDDELLIEKILMRDRGNNTVEITDLDYL